METVTKDKYPPKILKDTVHFHEKSNYVKMSYQVETYYQTEFAGEVEVCDVRTMRIEYSKSNSTLEFQNDDDFYGQCQVFHFEMIDMFREHLKGLGLEIL